MADGNLNSETQEQLALLEKALKELKKSATLSAKTQDEINAAVGKNADALEDNTEVIKDEISVRHQFVKDMQGFGGELTNAVDQLRTNRENFTSLNPAIRAAGQVFGAATKAAGSVAEAAGDNIQAMTKMGKGWKSVAGMIGGGALKALGIGAKKTGEAAGELAVAFGEFATGELQNVVEAYRKVGSAGAIGAGGMGEMYDSAIKLGIGLQGFAEVVSKNSQSLAYAGGGTKAGTDALVKLTEQSTQYENSLLALGYTFSEMRDDSAKFLERNRILGTASFKDQKKLAEASNAYMLQLDQLARVTGKSRDEIAKQLDQQMKDVRFQSTLRILEAKNGKESREAVENVATMLGENVDEASRKGFMDVMSGAANTPEAQAFLQTLTESGKQALQDMRTGSLKDATEGFKRITQSQKAWYEGRGGDETFSRIAKTGTAVESMIPSLMKSSQMNDEYYANLSKVNDEQKAASEAKDDDTKRVIDSQKKLQQMGQKLDEITRKEVLPNAAKAINAFTDALDEFVDLASKALGIKVKKKEPTSGLFSFGGGEAAKAHAGAVAGSSPHMGALMGAVGGAKASAAPAAGATPVAGSTQQILDTIKTRESGGNYQAQAKGSSASGAYQFTDSTWQGLTKKYGIGAEFAKAKDAPQQVQDAVAAKYIDEIMKKAGGDVSKVPLAWYTGNIQGKMSDKALAANAGLTPEMYQQKWMDQYSKSTGGATQAPTTLASTATTAPAYNAPARQSLGSSPRDQAYQQEMAKLDDQEARLAAAKARVMEARKQMAYKNPNGQVIVQKPDEPWAANGGVFSGPRSGYSATLHGNEAVVPLPSGDSIPVDMGGMEDTFDQQLELMEEQTASLEELLRTLRQGADISQRLLRVSQT
jgi:muramidase (phage lysozyme)